MSARRYTEAEFRAAVADPDVRTMADLCRAVGIVPRGANYETLRRYASSLGIPLTVEARRRLGVTLMRVDDQTFSSTLARARSIAEVIRELGMSVNAASYRLVRDRIERLGLDTSHLLGQAATRGRSFPERRRSVADLLQSRSSSAKLRERLVTEGLREHRCATCSGIEWLGGPIPLEIDHIDGDRENNTLANIRLLCPNCHALTPTYRGRYIGRYDGARLR